MKRILTGFAALAAFAAAVAASAQSAGAPPARTSAQRGLAIAQQHCAGCHAIVANTASSHPEAPSFEAIANAQGVTAQSLRRFLRDSHNYPAAMNFTIKRAHIRDLSAYTLTLRRPGYKPDI